MSASGDVDDLRRTVRDMMRAGADILHIGAVHPAGALAETLCEDGFRAKRLCVYDVVEADPRDLEWIAGQLGEIGTILVHSPRAGHPIAGRFLQQAADWRGEILERKSVVEGKRGSGRVEYGGRRILTKKTNKY